VRDGRASARSILYACFIDFTASKGNQVVVPFSSYGPNLNEQGNVLSLCAPKAPCLEANEAFLLLPEIAERCGFTDKLEQFLREESPHRPLVPGDGLDVDEPAREGNNIHISRIPYAAGLSELRIWTAGQRGDGLR